MTAIAGIPMEAEATLQRVQRLTFLLDSAFRVPGTRFRIGLDPIIGLIPGLGDAVAAALAAYVVIAAHRLGVRRGALARMLFNVAIDFLVGSIPLLGDAFDLVWKCNARNLWLLEREIALSREISSFR